MTGLTPNTTPAGEKCGSCLFAGTHTCAEHHREQVIVACHRFPPRRMRSGDSYGHIATLPQRAEVSLFPYTTWDDWCGEWQPRQQQPGTSHLNDEGKA